MQKCTGELGLLGMLRTCSVRNALNLNVAKCHIISFSKRDPSENYTYKINDVQIWAILISYAPKHQRCWAFYVNLLLTSGTVL